MRYIIVLWFIVIALGLWSKAFPYDYNDPLHNIEIQREQMRLQQIESNALINRMRIDEIQRDREEQRDYLEGLLDELDY